MRRYRRNRTAKRVNTKPNIIFIIGAPRSGTTWMWGLLSSHPNIRPINRDQLGTGTSFNKEGKRYTSETGAFVSNLSDKEIFERFTIVQKRYRYVVEKTPIHTFHIQRIKKIFPGSFILRMKRNEYDILTSMKFFFPNQKFDELINKLQSYLNEIKRQSANITCTVNYEDLVLSPIATLRGLLTRLDLDTKDISHYIKRNYRRTLLTNRPNVFRKGIIGDWRNNLTKPEIAQVKQSFPNIVPPPDIHSDV